MTAGVLYFIEGPQEIGGFTFFYKIFLFFSCICENYVFSLCSQDTNTMKTEIIDNRNRATFATGNWWGIVWLNESEMALEFDTKKQAVWFVNGGYKQFEF